MIHKVRNEAFRLFGRVLDLPAADSLENVETEYAQPVLDLGSAAAREVSTGSIFLFATGTLSGGNAWDQFILDFHDPTDWAFIYSPERGGGAVPSGQDVYIEHIGIERGGTDPTLVDTVMINLQSSFGGGGFNLPIFAANVWTNNTATHFDRATGGATKSYIGHWPVCMRNGLLDQIQLSAQASGVTTTEQAILRIQTTDVSPGLPVNGFLP